MATKKIAKIEIIKPGSNPDVDSDFSNIAREPAIDYVTNLYGKDNVANIVTFGTLAAKSAFKAMCTIYEVPFVKANKISNLVPPPIEGKDCTLADIYNPNSDRYVEAAEFREATSGEEWTNVIAGARAIEGRNKSTGVHACGIIISSRPLYETIPLHVRQDDKRTITQWTYQDCESLGLIKMDFLGLDNVDLTQITTKYIMRNGKKPVKLLDLIYGPMDDPKVYEMFQKAETTGIFQFGSEMVQKLLLQVKPTEFIDLATTTAIARPGPMGMQSHIKYADRKNGREKIDYIHPEFVGSELEKILGKTYGILVFQEQIMQISAEIAGMTLQEGDALRKAMGKKKMDVMMAMKPKFFEGAKENGYSEEAITVLWDNIEEFAKYGFNLSHSVAYAMNSYQSAYLKVHYPVEFMAALLSLHTDDKKKTLTNLREAKRMGISVGTVDINLSDVQVAPDFSGTSEKDILFGLSGIKQVSERSAEIIVQEREKNGKYTSVQDVIKRCMPLGITVKSVYVNLAQAGAFDSFNVSRKQITEKISDLMNNSKKTQTMGASLFDAFMIEDSPDEITLTGEEYPYLKKLQLEADMIGLYLTANPMDNIGSSISTITNSNIEELLKSPKRTTKDVIGTLIDIKRKNKKNGKMITVDIDDGKSYMNARLSKKVVKSIEKMNAQETVKNAYLTGRRELSPETRNLAVDHTIKEMDDIVANNIYVMNITYQPGRDDSPYSAQINWMKPLNISEDGSLPIRIRYRLTKNNIEKMRILYKKIPPALSKKQPGNYPIYVSNYHENIPDFYRTRTKLFEKALETIDNDETDYTIKDKEPEQKVADNSSLINSRKNYNKNISKTNKANKGKKNKEHVRQWPPKLDSSEKSIINLNKVNINDQDIMNDVIESIDQLEYKKTDFTCDKNNDVAMLIEKFLGAENYDFGVFNIDILNNND